MTVTYNDPVKTELLVVSIGDGAGSEVFTPRCSINTSRTLRFTAAAVATEINRCDTPGAPMKTVRNIKSVDWQFDGAGLMSAAESLAWAQWMLAGSKKNIIVNNGVTGALKLAGSAVLTAFEETGAEEGGMVTVSITLQQADLPVLSAAA